MYIAFISYLLDYLLYDWKVWPVSVTECRLTRLIIVLFASTLILICLRSYQVRDVVDAIIKASELRFQETDYKKICKLVLDTKKFNAIIKPFILNIYVSLFAF